MMNTLNPLRQHLTTISLLAIMAASAPHITQAGEAPLPPPSPRANQPAHPQTSPPAHGLREQLNPNDTASGKAGVDIRAYSRRDGTKISEYSRQGRVYMIKVQPPGNLPAYYLYDKKGNGEFSRLPGGYKPTSPPQWIIKEF